MQTGSDVGCQYTSDSLPKLSRSWKYLAMSGQDWSKRMMRWVRFVMGEEGVNAKTPRTPRQKTRRIGHRDTESTEGDTEKAVGGGFVL